MYIHRAYIWDVNWATYLGSVYLKGLVYKKHINTILWYIKTINFDDVTAKKLHIPHWPQIPDHSNNINNWWLWIKNTNALHNLISDQPDIDIFSNVKDLYETKY